jgi:TonB family protein
MSANILVIEYEPRYVEHVRKALAGPDFTLEIAGNMDDAVNRCASFEPAVVVITSVLPNLKIEDAITQLRARAGLRATPFLIVMSGYRGENPKEDAVRYGAQDILERPFGADALRERVDELVRNAPNPAATQAIPKEMLETLRRSAGLSDEGAQVTSDELFGDILSDMEGGEQQPVQAPPEAAPETPAESPPAQKLDDTSVDDMLADIVATEKTPAPHAASSTDEEVEKLLSDTLSGLDIAALKKQPAETGAPPDPVDRPPQPPPEDAPPPPVAALEPPSPAPPKEERQEAKAAPETPPVEAAKASPAEKTPVRKGHPPGPDRPAPSGTEFGQYVIEEHIATGGMADLYKARMMGMEGFQKTVAIKRILSNLTDSEEFVRMFIDEAKLAAQLNHNNIIHIYDLGKVDRSHYIAMEYIEGRDLRAILEECRERDVKMPIELALFITNLLASALDYAHKKRDFDNRALGLVHRDVSPQNVLISFEGDVKLCDFGIAKAASKASQTRAGALKGKLQYMSPEQAWGKDIDHRSDLFSLGLVLFEMLTNEKVFSGTSELSVLEQVRDPIITAPSMKNPDVDPEVDRVIFLALNAEREERYQSAEDMKRDLERIASKRGKAADRSTLVAFLDSLDSGERAAKPTEDVDRTPVPAEPPSTPPPPTPPAEAPFDASPEPPPSEGVDVVLAADQELEEVLSTPTPVETARLTVEDSGFPRGRARAGGDKKRLWVLLGVLAVVAIGAGGWFIFGRNGSDPPESARAVPVVPVVIETPTPEPTVGLMSEEELIDRAREVAAAEITKQEEELRKRLEEEFPTPTPIPPTPTPTDTPTPLPTDTPTPVPPTPTRVPPTATPIPPTPTPSVREGDIVVSGPGVIPPVMIFREPPKYPPAAERMGASGVVAAEALVGIDGTVEEVRITRVEGREFGFEKATEEAIYKWRYKPATKNGVRVRVWVTIRVPFRLQ